MYWLHFGKLWCQSSLYVYFLVTNVPGFPPSTILHGHLCYNRRLIFEARLKNPTTEHFPIFFFSRWQNAVETKYLQTESSIFLNIKKKGEMSPFHPVTWQWWTSSLVILYLLACGLLCDCFIGCNLDGIGVCRITLYSQLWKCYNLKNNEHARTSSLSASSLGQ